MMSLEEIKIKAPAIFANEPIGAVTDKYTFIPTATLLDNFKKLGWEVEAVRQQNSHVDSVHTKHMVILRNPILPAFDGNFPQLIMINSHDRTTSFKFMLGLFRLICENGLVVKTGAFESLIARHIYYTFEDLEALTKTVIENMPRLMTTVHHLRIAHITPEQQREFAFRALAKRFTEYTDAQTKAIDTNAIAEAIDMNAFLKPYRSEDEGDSVWSVFNRIQEKTLKGGFQRVGFEDKLSKRVRPVTNIKLDVSLNQELWAMASEYAHIN